MPDAVHGKVCREHECGEPGLECLCDDVVADGTIAEDVDLQPARPIGCRSGDVSGGRGRNRRKAHERPRSRGATRHGDLALLVRDLLERHRRNERGYRDRRPEHGRRGRHVRDVDEDARPQPESRERLAVPAQRALVASSADDVAPRFGSDDLLGESLGVVDGEELLHGRSAYRLIPRQFRRT